MEYFELPDSIKSSFRLSFEFKTEAEDGVMFYVSNQKHSDFVALYIKNGQVRDVMNI